MNANNTIGYYQSIKLSALTEDEYYNIKEAGLLWRIYPEASGIFKEDVMDKQKKAAIEKFQEEQLTNPIDTRYMSDDELAQKCMSRIDTIGQNGNEGSHYDDAVDYRVSGSDTPNVFPYGVGDDYIDKVYNHAEETQDKAFVDDYNPVDQPTHYQLGDTGLEAIDVIEAVLDSEEAREWLTPIEGGYYKDILKYIIRAPKKNQLEDIKKAKKYIDWLLISLGEEV